MPMAPRVLGQRTPPSEAGRAEQEEEKEERNGERGDMFVVETSASSQVGMLPGALAREGERVCSSFCALEVHRAGAAPVDWTSQRGRFIFSRR